MIRFRHFAIAALALIVSTAGAFAYIPCNILNSSAPISENPCSFEVQNFDHADPLRRPIAELDGSGTLIRRFIWGRGVVAQVEADGTVYYFHHDGQGSTLALSDANSVTTDTWFCSPYGEVMSRTGSTVTPYQWCGGVGVRRTANGLYFARHRYYHAGLKRWIARDPIGLAGGVNLYAYAMNAPWLYYDPWGLCAEGKYSLLQVEWAMGRTANRIAGNPAYGESGTIAPSLLDAFQHSGNTTSLGSSTVLFADALHAFSTGAPIKYGRYGMEITGRSARSSALAPQIARGVKVAGGVASVIGSGFDAHDAGVAFGSGDVATGISRASSMTGAVVGIVYWPAAVGTILGNATATGIETGYGAVDGARDADQLQTDETRMIQLMRIHRSLR